MFRGETPSIDRTTFGGSSRVTTSVTIFAGGIMLAPFRQFDRHVQFLHLRGIHQLRNQIAHPIDRNGKPDVLRIRSNRRVDADDLAVRVKQGAAAVPGVDRRVRLDQIFQRLGFVVVLQIAMEC